MKRFPIPASVAILAAVLLGGCVSSANSRIAAVVPPHISGRVANEMLVFSLRAAGRVKDDFLHFSLLDRILGVSIDAGLNREASAILTFADGILQRNNGREWYEEYSVVSANRRLKIGELKEAERMLSESLDRVEKLAGGRRKRFLFEEIIGTSLLGGETFQPLLRRTIDAVLILDDPIIKTELLVESARRFFGRGLVKDTQDLLQLTLSQIGSLGSPWDKAEIFSLVALVYGSLKADNRVREYADKAVSEIESVNVIIRTEQEAAKVGATAENLYRLSLPAEALRVADTIEYPWIYAETLCRMGIMSRKTRDGISENDLIDRAFEAASAISDDARRLSTLFQLDLLLVEAGRVAEIEDHLPLREAELSALRSLSVSDGFVSRLARLYSASGDADAAVRQARTIRDGYNRASTLIEIARAALEGEKSPKAFSILEESLLLAGTADRSRDRLYQDISAAYLAADDPARAVLVSMQIAEAYPLASATTEIARYLLTNEKTLDAESRELLQESLAGG